MDWQIIILTLGASIITGAVSLIGNIIVTKANIKKTIIESKALLKQEFMSKRMDAYNKILNNINYLELYIKNEDVLEKSNLEKVWLNYYPYCSKKLNNSLYMLIKYFDTKNDYNNILRISNIRKQIKKDLDEYYGIKDKIKIRED